MKIEYYNDCELLKTSLNIPDSNESFTELIGLDRVDIKILTDESILIGKASYVVVEEKNNNIFCFYTLKVEEEFRKQGFGTLLVNLRKQIADTLYPTLEMAVHCNKYSIGIFRKLGFIEKETYTILTKK